MLLQMEPPQTIQRKMKATSLCHRQTTEASSMTAMMSAWRLATAQQPTPYGVHRKVCSQTGNGMRRSQTRALIHRLVPPPQAVKVSKVFP
jgi:hypothetical protein